MKETTWQYLDEEFTQFPILKGEEVSEQEVDIASNLLGVSFPEDYRIFIQKYGAAIVGSFPIFGLRPIEPLGNQWSVVEVNEDYRQQGWKAVDKLLIFSADLSGNPIGIDENGKVWISDHDQGSVEELAENFEEFLLRHCLQKRAN